MNALLSQTRAELRLFIRDRTGTFFTILMPLLMVSFFGYLNRGREVESASYASFLLAGGIGIVTTGASFEVLGTSLARQRDSGILKRLGGTPLRASTLLGAKILTATAIILTQTVLMAVLMVGVFNAEITGSFFWTGVVLCGGIVTFSAMGCALAGISRNADVASAAAHAVALPMQFLCGTLFSIEVMPPLLQKISHVLPLTYFVKALRGAMLTGEMYASEWIIMMGCLVGSFLIVLTRFRWWA
jgi:ABC-2 type transport system permease protein